MDLYFILNCKNKINENIQTIKNTKNIYLSDYIFLYNPFVKCVFNNIMKGGANYEEKGSFMDAFKFWLPVMVKVILVICLFLYVGCLPCAIVFSYYVWKRVFRIYKIYLRTN